MTRPPGASVPLAYSGLVLAAFLLGAGPTASAGIFSASKNDVAVKVAELLENTSNALVRGLDFSPDGTRIAVDAEGQTINIWDWRNKRVERSLDKPHGGNDLLVSNPILYSPDARFLVNCEQSGEGDVVARIWDTANWSTAQ